MMLNYAYEDCEGEVVDVMLEGDNIFEIRAQLREDDVFIGWVIKIFDDNGVEEYPNQTILN